MIRLSLITLTGVHVDSEVHEVFVPTTAGVIAIYAGHAPLLGSLKPGIMSIRYKKQDLDDQREEVGVYDGTIEVLDNTIRVLADDVDTPGEVTKAEAEKALELAKALKKKAGDAVSLAEAQSMMDRSSVRLQLAGLRKHGPRTRR